MMKKICLSDNGHKILTLCSAMLGILAVLAHLVVFWYLNIENSVVKNPVSQIRLKKAENCNLEFKVVNAWNTCRNFLPSCFCVEEMRHS